MLVHCVFFWARPDLSPTERADFEKGLRTLLTIPVVVEGTVGAPAATARPAVDGSYAFALMLKFNDLAGHDAYQVDPIHNAFHDRCRGYWTKVTVYDFADQSTAS